jgi:DNA-3-methyladenine glycosylase I
MGSWSATTVSPAAGGVPVTRCTAATTTPSGADRSSTTGGCSRSCRWRGFQAGLSWLTILRKREHFRQAFDGFDPAAVAQFGVEQVERLLADTGIVRNRAKIEATINNAHRHAELAAEFGSLAAYVWRFEPDPQTRPPVLDHATLLQLGHSPESTAMSKDLRRRGWSFLGPTTVYAFMQAMGLVNDHLEGCDRRPPTERERHRFRRPSVAAADGTRQSGTADGRS